MISSEVQRTLVKSPPELWAELSDPAALARHLGELGEIRITRVEPEQKVEWETEDTTGTVLIDPSGWGTRVTLTVTREIAEPEPLLAAHAPAETEPTVRIEPEPALAAEPESILPESILEAEPDPIVQPGPGLSVEAEREPVVANDPEPAIETEPDSLIEAAPRFEPGPEATVAADDVSEAEHEPELAFVAELEPRRGFFARLFRRRRAEEQPTFDSLEAPSDEAPDAFAAVTRALAPETFAAAHPFAAAQLAAERPPEPTEIAEPARHWAQAQTPAEPEWDEPEAGPEAEEVGGISAEIRAAEEAAAEQVTAVLTSVLDRLGAAHHRPFSRA